MKQKVKCTNCKKFEVYLEPTLNNGLKLKFDKCLNCGYQMTVNDYNRLINKTNQMKEKQSFTQQDIEVLEMDFLEFDDKSIREFDISTVKGSIRLRTGEFITQEEVKEKRKKLADLKFQTPPK